MTESIELFAELRVMRSRIEAIEHTQEILVHAQKEQILPPLLDRFAKDPALANVYLLIDGRRTQNEIVAEMKARGLDGASEATVSRKIDLLNGELALVDLADQDRSGKIYQRSAVDRILKLERMVRKIVDGTRQRAP